MRAVIQRVLSAGVKVEGRTTGEIEKGFLILLGVSDDDGDEDLEYMVKKISKLRVFEDDQGKMNLALEDVGGSVLVVSQFTLFANTKKGNRPSFVEAGSPDYSNKMYRRFIDAFRELGINTAEGEFGADMKVSMLGDGPVTICIDSKNR